MSDISKNSITIEAPVEEVEKVLFDPSTYPTWSSAIPSAKVLTTDDAGRASKVEMSIKAGPVKDRVTLDYDWSKAPGQLNFTLDEADMLTEMSGSYIIVDNGDDTTTVTYELTVGLSMPVPAMMRQKAERDTIDAALKELKSTLEA
ncbi:MAG: hypothetical protein RL414_881 [Actinomycetota bacterium]